MVTVTERFLQGMRPLRAGQVWAGGPHGGPAAWAGHWPPVTYSHTALWEAFIILDEDTDAQTGHRTHPKSPRLIPPPQSGH